MLAAHSRPLKPRRATWRAIAPRLAPDSAQTVGGRGARIDRTVLARLTSTTPRRPLSLTSTLEPLPKMKKGISSSHSLRTALLQLGGVVHDQHGICRAADVGGGVVGHAHVFLQAFAEAPDAGPGER